MYAAAGRSVCPWLVRAKVFRLGGFCPVT